MAFHAAEVLDGGLDKVAWLAALLKGVEHLADLGFRVDMRAGAAGAEVCQAAEVAVLRTDELERACADEMSSLAGRATAGVACGDWKMRGESRWELRFRGALEAFH